MKDHLNDKVIGNYTRSRKKSEDSKRPRGRREISLPLRRPMAKQKTVQEPIQRHSLAHQPQNNIKEGKEWIRTSPKISQKFAWDRGANVKSSNKIKREEFMVEGNKIDKKEAKFRIKNGDLRNLDFFERSGLENPGSVFFSKFFRKYLIPTWTLQQKKCK